MINVIDKAMCCGCSACASACPKNCIEMTSDTLGFLYPKVVTEQCVNCGLCEMICPNLKDEKLSAAVTPKAYAAIGRDNTIRQKSSSGGVFSLIAQHIISQGGVVYGAAFDDSCHTVRHIAVDFLDGLGKLRGAKYLQSDISGTYVEVKERLEQGRTVLFTGTPCQISGLKSFLQKDYDQLYLQDIVCHGVPSPSIWDAYLGDIEKRFGGHATDVSFRNKSNGWKNYCFSIQLSNGRIYSVEHSKDPYMRGFLHNYYLRPSCYACKHKGVERQSDITLADFWGIEEICPEMDDQKGTSLVIVSSPKGQRLFEAVVDAVNYAPTDLECAIQYNRSMIDSAKEHSLYKVFEREFPKKSIRNLFKKYCSASMWKKIKRKAGAFLRRR